jgi:glycosyltransferase involved in cell wall biosynthesis
MSTLSFGATAHLDASLRRYDAALVLNVANGFYLPLLRARGIPTVVNPDGLEWERGKWGPAARRVFRAGAEMTARYADVLVTDSMAVAEVWRTLFQVESTFVPYGAPVVTLAGSDRVEALGLRKRRYVLVVARLIPENNVDLVLDAVDRMSERPQTVIVGAATTASQTEARLRAGDRAHMLRWLGHVHDQVMLTQLWANAGVYVHGHSAGGTNPGLLQALGAGAPTLALDTPFNREVMRNDEQIFSARADHLASKIRNVLSDSSTQDRFTAHGRAVVRDHYDWSDISMRYLAALAEARRRSIARGRRGPRAMTRTR